MQLLNKELTSIKPNLCLSLFINSIDFNIEIGFCDIGIRCEVIKFDKTLRYTVSFSH